MDVCVIKPISLPKFLKLVPFYSDGTYLDNPEFESITTYRRCKKVEVKAPEGFAISLDGEIVEVNEFTCEVMPGEIKFAVPAAKEAAAEKKEAAAAK